MVMHISLELGKDNDLYVPYLAGLSAFVFVCIRNLLEEFDTDSKAKSGHLQDLGGIPIGHRHSRVEGGQEQGGVEGQCTGGEKERGFKFMSKGRRHTKFMKRFNLAEDTHSTSIKATCFLRPRPRNV